MFFGFQPGLVPGSPDTALPIETIFPELSTIEFNWISDATVVDGHVFMTLSGDDGLFLFGAPAPVTIPEPSTLSLAVLGGIVVCGAGIRFRFSGARA